MSISVFPSEIGQDVNGANAWGFKLPVKKTPSFKTTRQMPANNRGELAISLTQYPIWEWEMTLAYMRGDYSPAQYASALQLIVGFYGQMQGSAGEWLYFDPNDNGSNSTTVASGLGIANLTYNSVGTGDGHNNAFLLTRSIGGMTDLIQNFAAGYPLVYVAGVLQSPTLYSIDLYGNLLFTSAPALGQVVAWYGQFYFLCRFDDDKWALEGFRSGLWRVDPLKFHSILR